MEINGRRAAARINEVPSCILPLQSRESPTNVADDERTDIFDEAIYGVRVPAERHKLSLLHLVHNTSAS